MSRKRIEARREANRALGAQDAAKRCTFCRRALVIGYLTVLTPNGDALKYCNQDCQGDHADALAAMTRKG